jgi:hypothetical protein
MRDDCAVSLCRVHRVDDRLFGEGRASGVDLRSRFAGGQRRPPSFGRGVRQPLDGCRGVADDRHRRHLAPDDL